MEINKEKFIYGVIYTAWLFNLYSFTDGQFGMHNLLNMISAYLMILAAFWITETGKHIMIIRGCSVLNGIMAISFILLEGICRRDKFVMIAAAVIHLVVQSVMAIMCYNVSVIKEQKLSNQQDRKKLRQIRNALLFCIGGILLYRLYFIFKLDTYLGEMIAIGISAIIAIIGIFLFNKLPKQSEGQNSHITVTRKRVIACGIIFILIVIGTYTAKAAIIKDTDRVPISGTTRTLTERDEEILVQMRQAGFPEEILNDLPSEVIATYDGVEKAEMYEADGVYDRYGDVQKNCKLGVQLIYSTFTKDSGKEYDTRVMVYGQFRDELTKQLTDTISVLGTKNKIKCLNAYGSYQDTEGRTQYYPLQYGKKKHAYRWDDGKDVVGPSLLYGIPTDGKELKFVIDCSLRKGNHNEEEMRISVLYQHQFSISARLWRNEFDYEPAQFEF